MNLKFLTLALVVSSSVAAYIPTNIHLPFDGDFSQRLWAPHTTAQLGVRGQILVGNKAYDADEHRVPVTQIYSAKESTLAMLEGSVPGTPLHALANRLRTTQDGVRGMFEVDGDFSWRQLSIDALYRLSMIKLPGIFSIGVHVPIVDASFNNIAWRNITKTQTGQDNMVRTLLVHDQQSLSRFVMQNSDLDISAQHRTGLGDISSMLYWQAHFTQHQKRLREVLVQLRVGLKIPTAHRVDINKAFDIDFGHDGGFGVPLGGGLRLDLGAGVRIGMDVGTLFIVRRLQEWRLKTSLAQTPYLMLTKGLATKEYGPEWRFTLFGQVEAGTTGVFCSAAYQFFKHTDSTLYPQSDAMSSSLINSTPLVDASESHNMIGNITYIPPRARYWGCMPESFMQVTVPFGGKSIMSGVVVSAGVGIKF